MNEDDIVYRLRKRAEIRRQIPNRKSVQEGKPDRIADLLEEAADIIEESRHQNTGSLKMNEHNTDSADCWCDPEVREVGDSKVIIHKEIEIEEQVPCKTHPDAPHGFDRNASHSLDRYVCTCEHWEPEE